MKLFLLLLSFTFLASTSAAISDKAPSSTAASSSTSETIFFNEENKHDFTTSAVAILVALIGGGIVGVLALLCCVGCERCCCEREHRVHRHRVDPHRRTRIVCDRNKSSFVGIIFLLWGAYFGMVAFFGILGSDTFGRHDCNHIDGACFVCNTWYTNTCSICHEGYWHSAESITAASLDYIQHDIIHNCSACPIGTTSTQGSNYGFDSCHNATKEENEQKHKLHRQLNLKSSSLTNFLDSAKNGKLAAVKKSVEYARVDLETKSKDGYTALIYAAAKNHFEIVDYLIKMGANVNAQDVDGLSALDYAKKKSHKKIIQLLENARVDLETKSKDGYTALASTSAAISDKAPSSTAASSSTSETIFFNEENKHDFTTSAVAILVALIGGGIVGVLALLCCVGCERCCCEREHRVHRHRVDPHRRTRIVCDRNKSSFVGIIFLLWGAYFGMVAFFGILGSDTFGRHDCNHIDGACFVCNTWYTNTCSICHEGYWHSAESITAASLDYIQHDIIHNCSACPIGTTSTQGSNYGFDSCHNATKEENEQKHKLHRQLNLKSSSLTNFLDSAKNGKLAAVKKSVEYARVDLETKSKDGYTALIYAAAKNHFEIVDYLIKMGANVNAQDVDGLSALDYAKKKSHKKIIQLLENNNQLLPLGHLFNNNIIDKESVLRRLDVGETKLGLIDSSHPLVLKNVEKTLLNAAKLGDLHFIRLLLQITHSLKKQDLENVETSVSIDARDDDGMTALMWSAVKGHEKITRILIDAGANRTLTTSGDMTAINFAAMNGHDSVIRRLNHHESLWYGRYVVGPLVSLLVLAATVYVSIPLCTGTETTLTNGAQVLPLEQRSWLLVIPMSAVAVGFLLLYLGDQDEDGDIDRADAFDAIDENKDDTLDTSEVLSASFNLSGIIGSFILVQILLLAVYAKYFSVQNTKIAIKRKELDDEKTEANQKRKMFDKEVKEKRQALKEEADDKKNELDQKVKEKILAVDKEVAQKLANAKQQAAIVYQEAQGRLEFLENAAKKHEERMITIGALSCAYCHSKVATSINVPCQHQILCDTCAIDFRIKNKKDICPVEECGQPSTLKQVRRTYVNCSSCHYQWESMYEFKVSSDCFHLLCVPCMVFHVRNSVSFGHSIRDGGIPCPWKRKIHAKVLESTGMVLTLEQNSNIGSIEVGQHMFLQKGNSIGLNPAATVREVQGATITLETFDGETVSRDDVVGNEKMVVFEQCCSAQFKQPDFLRLKKQSELVAILSKNLPKTKGGEIKGGETKGGETKGAETGIPLPDIQTNTIDHVVALFRQGLKDVEIKKELKKHLKLKLREQQKILRQAKEKLPKVVVQKEYGHDGTDRFTSKFEPFSDTEATKIKIQFLLSDIPGNLGVFCSNERCPLPLDPLIGLNPRPASLKEAADMSFFCSNCSEEMCRLCRVEGCPAKWHEGETCTEAEAARKKSASADDIRIEAYSKHCPNCNIRGQHFHGHECHHISPGTGCPHCNHHYCYGCAAYTVKGREIKGPRSGEGGSCRKNPRHGTYCSRDNLRDNIDTSNGWPLDERCGCAICPDCRPGRKCATCPGNCVVCRGEHPPGEPVKGSELEKLVKLAEDIQRRKVLRVKKKGEETKTHNRQLAPNVQTIVDMGFTESRAIQAVRRHGDDVGAAVSWLLKN